MAGVKQLRSWFFGVSSDATRLRNSDKPPQQTFENLLESVAFKTESSDRARVSTGATVSSEQGLAVLASDAQAKSNATQLTDRSLVVQPSQLPTLEVITNSATEDMPTTGLFTQTAATTTRNQYQIRFAGAWITWLISRIFKAGGTAGQVPIKTNGTDYNWAWGQLATDSTFVSALLANTTFVNSLTTQIITNNPTAIIDGLPVGTVLEWTDDAVPTAKWVFAQGQAINRTTYASYFALVGTTWGVGDGSTTFNIIDRREKFGIGVGGSKTLASTGGAETHTIASANLPTHTHDAGTFSISSSGAHGHTWSNSAPPRHVAASASAAGADVPSVLYNVSSTTDIDAASGAHTHTITGGSSGNGGFANTAINHMNPWVAVNYIVKVLP
jgi:microcystin-dependent protein